MHKKFLLPTLLVALAALVLAACGGSDNDEGGDEDAIVTAIETSTTGADPADCKVYATQAFLEQAQMETGKAALESCEADAEDGSDNPGSVEVENVKVGNGTASAEVSFDGGAFNGQTLAVGLVENGGEWKLDSIDRYVGFDRGTFIAEFEKGLNESSASSAEKACVMKAADAADNAELEALVISGSEATLYKVAGEC